MDWHIKAVRLTTLSTILIPLIITVSACSESPVEVLTDDDRAAFLDSLTVAADRTFSMGFTPWPYDFTDVAQDETYASMRDHSDFVLFHLDNGVPWPEVFAGEAFHPHVQQLLDRMKAESVQFDKVYVSATAQKQDRLTLAGYWGADEHLDSPAPWATMAFDDPDVITTYAEYCRRLIQHFDPDYFAYGIEVNGTLTLDHPDYQAYRSFVANVYTFLKSDYPDLPIFLTFQTGSFSATWEEQQALNGDLIEFSDYVGMSTYPFWVPGLYEPRDADLSYLPGDWFQQMRNIAPNKPFVITETGYNAEDFKLSAVNIRGRELWQAQYVDRLLWSAHDLEAEFVAWFVVRDYDQGFDRLRDLGVDTDAFRIWRDTGLLNSQGKSRLGMEVWDRWLVK